MTLKILVAACSFAAALLLLLHHKLKHGSWIDQHNLASHEALAVALTMYAAGLLSNPLY